MPTIPQADLVKALKSLDQLMKGITPLGAFWIMKKTSEKMKEAERVTMPSRLDVVAALKTV